MNSLINIKNFKEISGDRKKQIINFVRKSIAVVNKPNKNQWDDYWGEIKTTTKKEATFFEKEGYPFIFRLNDKYVEIKDKNFAKKILRRIIRKLIKIYFQDAKYIVEFGSGTGSNLELIRSLGDFKVYGSDFCANSIEILNKKNIKSFYFDMQNPDINQLPMEIRNNLSKSTFLTSGSMEQLDKKWRNFFSFVEACRPKRLINIEPIYEYYNDSVLGELAKEFHDKKRYFKGYLSLLKESKNDIIEHRHEFGTLFDEGFNVIVVNF